MLVAYLVAGCDEAPSCEDELFLSLCLRCDENGVVESCRD